MRHAFGGSLSDVVVQRRSDNLMQVDPGVTLTFWTAATSGTQVTDLQDMSGHAIMSVTTDSNGVIPQFMGPNDGTSTLWASAGGLDRQVMQAIDVANRVTALETASTAAIGFAFIFGG